MNSKIAAMTVKIRGINQLGISASTKNWSRTKYAIVVEATTSIAPGTARVPVQSIALAVLCGAEVSRRLKRQP